MSKYSIEDLEKIVEQNRAGIALDCKITKWIEDGNPLEVEDCFNITKIDLRNVVKILLKEARDQNDRILELSRLSRGQLEIINSLSHTVNIISEALQELKKRVEEEDE
jgi:hypothetical protein